MRFFRADAAFAVPELYKTPEAEGCSCAVRPGKTAVSESRVAPVLKRPAGRLPTHVRRICGDSEYQAASRDKSWRVVTNPPMEPARIIRFYNQRGTAEQHVEEGRQAINRTRLSCKGMARNEVRLQLHASACNPGVFLQGIDLPEETADRSPTGLRTRLIRIGVRIVRHARAVTFQPAEAAVGGALFTRIPAAIQRLRASAVPYRPALPT